MGNFETIVRPVIFPNIRPVQARSVSPESDPEKGFARINGQGGKIVSLPHNFTHNISRQKQKEAKRRVDEVRVYQKEEDGTINRDNFIDIQVANKSWMRQSGPAGAIVSSGSPVTAPGVGPAILEIPSNFIRAKEADNIEIRKENVIIENEDD